MSGRTDDEIREVFKRWNVRPGQRRDPSASPHHYTKCRHCDRWFRKGHPYASHRERIRRESR